MDCEMGMEMVMAMAMRRMIWDGDSHGMVMVTVIVPLHVAALRSVFESPTEFDW